MTGKSGAGDAQAAPPEHETERLAAILEMLVGLASGEFDIRLPVGDGQHLLDGISSGLNMLAEELIRQRTFEQAVRARAREGERLALVGRLAAGVAHEVNNPAAFVLANLTNLRALWHVGTDGHGVGESGVSPSEVVSMLQESIQGVERIVAAVGGLKALAQRQVGPHVPVDVTAVLDDACRMTERLLRARAQFHRPRQTFPPVLGDHAELVQVCANLLMNAAEALPEGQSDRQTIEVRGMVSGGHLTIAIRDTGCGIAAEHQAQVFEPFFSTKGRGLGFGLGLSTSLDIVSRHGGALTFESLPGRGSTFNVSLPLAALPPEPPRPASPEPDPLGMVRQRLLLVDDEELLLKSYQRLYGSQYTLVVATGGAMAKRILEQDQSWDAIMCDLTMPDIDGPTLIGWLTEQYPALARRVIVCSGGAFTPSAMSFLNRFTGPRLSKPFRRFDLMRALAALPPPDLPVPGPGGGPLP